MLVTAGLVALLIAQIPSSEAGPRSAATPTTLRAAQGRLDQDRDGLDDRLEQALLERFLPTFLLSRGECDGWPASFEAGVRDPRVLARDGTIYGQVFPVARTASPSTVRQAQGRAEPGRGSTESGPAGAAVEIHYFHLWANDCGRGGHALDAEHVSALVESARLDAPAGAWTARLWYAAAHEGTLCDASSGAHASSIGAERAGPDIFVSRGKHASYLTQGQCKWGCGGDVCSDAQPLQPAAIINIGEPGAPMNGAEWVASRRWNLADKLQSDFDPAIRTKLDASNTARVISLMIHLRAPQAPVLAGDTVVDALATAGRSTSSALNATGDVAAQAVGASAHAVGASMKRTASGIARFLRLRQ